MAGASLGIYIGGFIGSISQLTAFTEISTIFVNFRTILVYHHATDNIVYAVNGLMMTFSFFFVRVLFYYYIIFWKMQDMVMYRFESFWATYDKEVHYICWICLYLYLAMYILNLYWF